MVLAITVLRILNLLLIGPVKSSLIGGQPAGLEESSALVENVAPSSVVRDPFPPPPSEVLSGNGTVVIDKSTKGLPSIYKILTETNKKRQRGRRAGRGSKGFIERRTENRGETGRKSISWREGSQSGRTSRQRRTTTHCFLERSPVHATEVNVMIHIRPKSLPFAISVTMINRIDHIPDSPIVPYPSTFRSESIAIGWRIGHWTAVHLSSEFHPEAGYTYVLVNQRAKHRRGYRLLPSIIDISPDEADWYIGDRNQACLDEEKAGKFYN